MAIEGGQDEGEDQEAVEVVPNGKPPRDPSAAQDDVSEEEEEEEEEEPRLKYATLTKHLTPVYRHGDAVSTFMVAGDKMIIGTHNGYIHVYSVPYLNPIKVFHAHQASISAVSISPCPPPLAPTKTDSLHKAVPDRRKSPAHAGPPPSKDSPKKTAHTSAVPNTPSNAIHVASSSIDGNVFISSLIDSKDVQLRNFGRPVQALGLSPEFKSDRSYLSGGRAGSLVLTVGGQTGTRTNATTAGAPASGWLGSIGLGTSSGKDEVLHSGEGAISTIKWSLSGRYVVWVNEKGIKLMRSNLHLESGEAEQAWKRISHIDHPSRPGWDEMAGIWKAHVQWVDEAGLESDDFYKEQVSDDSMTETATIERMKTVQQSRTIEKLIVGWSGTLWIINVQPSTQEETKTVKTRKSAKAEIVTILRIDCTISGLSLYTPNLLVILAFLTPEDDLASVQKQTRRGRQNARQAEVRIIDINTKEEVSIADTLDMSRYESLSATDYHLDVLPAIRLPKQTLSQRGALEAIGGGIEAIGGGIWDATMYPARLFTNNPSVRSAGSPSSSKAPSIANAATDLKVTQNIDELHPSALTHGIKVFIQSPYDCIMATKPTLSDHFAWLESHQKYEDAWTLLERSPEAVSSHSDKVFDSSLSSPTKGSLTEFFADDSSQATTVLDRGRNSKVEKEKLRVGDLWIQQLVTSEEWHKAGETCGQVLGQSSKWEHWVTVFTRADKFDEITPFVPGDHPSFPLPSGVYETLLGHYVSNDRPRFAELLEKWPPELYNVDTILGAIQSKFKSGEVREDSVEDDTTGRDWRILMESLAKLFLAVGRPKKALRCYIQLQDSEAAMSLIADAHLVEAVKDDISGFVLLQVNKAQQRSAPLSELATQTLDPIRLLVSAAHQRIVRPETVIEQLKARFGMPNPYLFFYFRALWHGDTAPSQDTTTTRRTAPASESLSANDGKTLVSDDADTAVTLFAEYDRDLLMAFLKSSQSYTLSLASRICEQRHYIPELVYLLSKEGRTTQALGLIIDQLGDVSQAITFAKEQNDATLWDDLLDYSMSKPSFIRGLLEEVGTSIDPLKLVQRIPPGLEIEGLRSGLGKMLREYEVHESISKGVARVLRGEVNAAMQQRSSGLRKGIRFDVAKGKRRKDADRRGNVGHVKLKDIRPGHCAGCGDAVNEQDHPPTTLLAFPCTHTFHLPCLLAHAFPPGTELPAMLDQFTDPIASADEEWELPPMERSIGPKVDRARLLRTVLGEGCPLEEKEAD